MSEQWRRWTEPLERSLFLGIPASDWLTFLVVTLVIFGILQLVRTIAHARVRSHAGTTEHKYDDYLLRLLDHTWTYGVLALAVFLALYFVELRGAEVVRVPAPASASADDDDAAPPTSSGRSRPRGPPMPGRPLGSSGARRTASTRSSAPSACWRCW